LSPFNVLNVIISTISYVLEHLLYLYLNVPEHVGHAELMHQRISLLASSHFTINLQYTKKASTERHCMRVMMRDEVDSVSYTFYEDHPS